MIGATGGIGPRSEGTHQRSRISHLNQPPADFTLPPCEIVPALPIGAVIPLLLLIPIAVVLLIVTIDHTISGRNTAIWVGGIVAVYVVLGVGFRLFVKQRCQRALRKLPPDVIFKGEANLRPLGRASERADHGHLVLDFQGITFISHRSQFQNVFKLAWSEVSHMHLQMGRFALTLKKGQTEVIEIPRYGGLAERLRQLPMRRE